MYLLPAGMRDWLPQELALKQDVESKIRAVLKARAYPELATPFLERAALFRDAAGAEMSGALHLSDPLGADLVLRTDMTTPIARAVSARFDEDAFPLRLSYIAPVFQYESQRRIIRESTQAGVELIGTRSLEADAESLHMAIETLDALGLRDACFDINDTRIVDDVLNGFSLGGPEILKCKALVAERNMVALEEFGKTANVDPVKYAAFLRLIMLHGKGEALDTARELCDGRGALAAIDQLSELLRRSEELGYGERVSVDFALLRRLHYYTGFVFEAYVRDLGFWLCGGGRYDTLLPQFGKQTSGVGWMLVVERVLLALERRNAREGAAAQ